MQARDWPNAAKVMQRLARAFGALPGLSLSDAQAGYVLNLAIAFTLSGNERGLIRLRDDYRVEMAKTTFADAFNLIASPDALGLIDYRTIAGRVKEASNFGTFLAAYCERVKSGQLSRTN